MSISSRFQSGSIRFKRSFTGFTGRTPRDSTGNTVSSDISGKNGLFPVCWNDRHLWNAIRYVEQNPVRAGIVTRAADYRWSSAAAHCGLEQDSLLTKSIVLVPPAPTWTEWLDGPDSPQADKFIRQCTSTGRPCGDDAFVKHVEESTGRDFTRKKPGPKAKVVATEPPLFD